MTAGQEGGPPGWPGSQPGASEQGGPPAVQPPGYAPAPPPPPAHGWPPFPPPYPGYDPAAAFGGGGGGQPPGLERPTTVRAGLGAFIAGLILGLIGLIYEVVNFDDIIDAERAAILASGGGSPGLTGDIYRSVLVAGMVVGVLFLALEATFVWFAWRGHNWARIVLWVIAGLGVVFGLFGLVSTSYLPGFLHALNICQWLLIAASIVLLALGPSNEWYRYRRWLRDTGRPG